MSAQHGDAPRDVVERWYRALETQDLEAFRALHRADCVYNISGHTPISGRVEMPALMQHVLPAVFGRLEMQRFRFGVRRGVVCAEGRRVVGMMEADGPTVDGLRYDQRYIHIFDVSGDRLTEVWEFFDTALANAALFAELRAPVAGVQSDAFHLPGGR